MVTTVKLQSPFEYSPWVNLVALLIALLALGLLFYAVRSILRLREKKSGKNKPVIRRPSPIYLGQIKAMYSGQAAELLAEYQKGSIDIREAYQRLSMIIRGFVHGATGINVETLTLSEVRRTGIRKLDVLMAEYYVPEFAEDERGQDKDFVKSCNTAMGVIKSWS